MKSRMTKLLGLFALIMFGLIRAGAAQQVQAELSQDYAAVGQPVRLNISVTGARGAQVPQQLNIDGIDARFIGKSEQMQWQMNGRGGQLHCDFHLQLSDRSAAARGVHDSRDSRDSWREDRQDVAAHLACFGRSRRSRPAGNSRSSRSDGAAERFTSAPRAGHASLARFSIRREENRLWRSDYPQEDRLCWRGRAD